MSDNPLSTDNAASIVARVKAILLNPKEVWPAIAAETKNSTQILIQYAIPLMLISPICSLIGSQVFGYSALGITYRPSLTLSLSIAVSSFVMSIVALYVVSFIVNFFSPKFGGKENFDESFKLVAYSFTAAWVVGIFGLIPMLSILGILGLYSIYLLYVGATPVMGIPEDKAGTFTAVTFIAAIVVMIILNMIAATLVGGGSAFRF